MARLADKAEPTYQALVEQIRGSPIVTLDWRFVVWVLLFGSNPLRLLPLAEPYFGGVRRFGSRRVMRSAR